MSQRRDSGAAWRLIGRHNILGWTRENWSFNHSGSWHAWIIEFGAPLRTTEHPEPQQVKVGTTEHKPFLQLQAVHLRFHLPLTPGGSESGAHGSIIATDTLSKALQFANSALFRLDEPFIQILIPLLGQHRDKCLGELVGDIEIMVSRSELFDRLALLLVEFGRLADTEPGGSSCGHATFGRGLWWEVIRGADRALSR